MVDRRAVLAVPLMCLSILRLPAMMFGVEGNASASEVLGEPEADQRNGRVAGSESLSQSGFESGEIDAIATELGISRDRFSVASDRPRTIHTSTQCIVRKNVRFVEPLRLVVDNSLVAVEIDFTEGEFAGVHLETNAKEAIRFSPRVVDCVINRCNIKGGQGTIGIQHNQPSAIKLEVSKCKITDVGYGILINEKSQAESIIIEGNTISSFSGDGIAVNAPWVGIRHVLVSGNAIETDRRSKNHSSGFGISLARVGGGQIIGNHITGEVREGIHIEDISSNIVISNNIISVREGDGIRVIAPITERLKAAGMVPANFLSHLLFENNFLTGASSGVKMAAIRLVEDSSGSVRGISIAGNSIIGFGTGLSLGQARSLSLNGNIIENCGSAFYVGGVEEASVSGSVIVDCDVLAILNGRNILVGAGNVTDGLNFLFRPLSPTASLGGPLEILSSGNLDKLKVSADGNAVYALASIGVEQDVEKAQWRSRFVELPRDVRGAKKNVTRDGESELENIYTFNDGSLNLQESKLPRRIVLNFQRVWFR